MSTIYERLVELKLKALKGKVDLPEEGICYNASCSEFSEENAKDWPDFSGSVVLPIQHPSFSPLTAYRLSIFNKNQFDISTEYGRNRMRYLDFLIHRAKLQGV